MSLQEEIPAAWQQVLQAEFSKSYFHELNRKVAKARESTIVYPPKNQVFQALRLCSYDKCKLLLLGQDPYHGPGQAHGLSFSVQDGVRIPPSLRNMYKEYHTDLGLPIPKSGNLTPWAKQGVLMLNATLTVEHKKANSHAKFGWMQFTDAMITALSSRQEPLVFLLWGGFAKKKLKLIDQERHRVITAVHPSPLSARHGFWGSKPYSKVNAALVELGYSEINWALS